MAHDLLLSAYATNATVRNRNLGSLVVWASGMTAQPLPPDAPAEDWVRLRIMAERIPAQAATLVERTIAYFMQDPAVTTGDLSEWMSPYNDSGREDLLSQSNSRIIAGFMPRFVAMEVSDDQVHQWYLDNGYTVPAG